MIIANNDSCQKPDVWHIENVTVTRVVEIETRGGPPNLLFQGLNHETHQNLEWWWAIDKPTSVLLEVIAKKGLKFSLDAI